MYKIKKVFKSIMLASCWITMIVNGALLALSQAVIWFDGDWELYEEDGRFMIFIVARMILAAALRIYIIKTVKIRQKGGETEES